MLIIALQVLAMDEPPKPHWVEQIIFPPYDAGYVLASGGATDENVIVAKNKATVNAIRKASQQVGGVIIEEQTFSEIEKNGLDAIIGKSKRRFNELCYEVITLKDGRKLVYVLIQMEKNYHIPAQFNMLPEELQSCRTKKFERDFEKWTDDMAPLTNAKYIALAVNSGYPLTFGIGISGRYGKILGFGYYANVGLGVKKNVHLHSHDIEGSIGEGSFVPFHYKIGLKFYAYHGVYLSCDYGTLGARTDNNYYYDNIDAYYADVDSKAWKDKQWINSGMTISAGWDYVTDLTKGTGFFLSVNGGVSRDFQEGNWSPVFGVSIGVAFGM